MRDPITNGEAAELEMLALFLKWMRAEDIRLPETPEQVNRVLLRYLKHCRREVWRHLYDRGKITKEVLDRMVKRVGK